jgi:hypothetical protein
MPQLIGSTSVSIANASPPTAMEALRNKILQLEKKEAATQRQMEVMQRRFDRQEADRKSELHKQEAQVRCDKLEAKAEMDTCKRDAQARCDKLEAKAEMDTCKRDAQARCDKLEAKAETDKRDTGKSRDG